MTMLVVLLEVVKSFGYLKLESFIFIIIHGIHMTVDTNSYNWWYRIVIYVVDPG